MLSDIVGVLVVNGALLLFMLLLSRRHVLNQGDPKQRLGVMFVLMPVGLLAWLRADGTLAFFLPLTIIGTVLLLLGGRRSTGSRPGEERTAL